MSDDDKTNEPKAQADSNAIAIGGINIGGDINGNIQIGHTTGYTSEQVAVLITQIQSTFQPKPFDGRCPYKGLDVFEEEDAELFFGREKLVVDLVCRVKDARTVFVTGPSGSGKSSLVRAGLIHALKQGAIKGSERWLYAAMKPGRDPLESLATAFSRLKSPELGNYFRQHLDQVKVLHECAESTLTENKNQRLVLFIDQFEEVFTQISKEEERVAFLNLLTHADTIENGRVIILFSMRSDFVSNCATYPQLNAQLNQQFVQIGAMQPEELVSAIAQPALRVGLRIDPDLIAQTINEMKGEPGALPLMQFALKDLFDSQQEKSGVPALILNDYLQRGGIHKALERHADDSFSKLRMNEQELARSIFSGLIEIGRGTQDTKRTAMFEELVPADTKAEEVEAIVQKLADARLVTTDEHAGKDTVTISHEKLIDAWPWLKKLVNENRDMIALQNQIAADVKEWEEHKRDASYLYAGVRWINANEQLKEKKIVLSGTAFEFIQAGRLRVRRRQIGLIGSILITFTLLVIALAFFVNLTNEANKQTNIAQTASILAAANEATAIANEKLADERATLARARELAAGAGNILNTENSPNAETATLLALRSLHDVYTDDAYAILAESMRRLYAKKMFIGHSDDVASVSFSPSGRFVLTGSFDTTARLWDVNTGETINIFSGHVDTVRATAFSPDGKYILTGSFDTTSRLWDVETGETIRIFSGHQGEVYSVAFSPDGKYVLTGSEDKTARLWDIHTGEELLIFKGHTESVRSVAFSPDGKYVLTGSRDNTARLWDTYTGTQLLTFRKHTSYIYSVAFSPDGKHVLTGSWDNTVRLWDVNTGEVLRTFTGHTHRVYSVAFSQDGNNILTGSWDNTARLWDVDTGAVLRTFSGHTNHVWSAVFSPDGQTILTGGEDDTGRLWNTNTDTTLRTFQGHTSAVWGVSFLANSNAILTASGDNTARFWSVETEETLCTLSIEAHSHSVSVAVSPDGKYALIGNEDSTARLWDVSICKELRVFKGHQEPVRSVAFSSDGKYVLTGSEDYTAKLWDANSGEMLHTFIGHSNSIYSVAFSPENKYVVTGSIDRTARLWDTNSGAMIRTFVGHSDSVYSVAFSPDGNYILTGSKDKTARLWDANTGAQLRTFWGHTSSINSVAFSSYANNYVLTGSDDYTARLWDVNTGDEMRIFKGHRGEVYSVAFSLDGRYILTGSEDSTARLWDVRYQDTIRLACSIIIRDFTEEERNYYQIDNSPTCP